MAPHPVRCEELPIYGEMYQQREAKAKALHLFHFLWGRDQETPTYDKSKWMELQAALHKLGVVI